MKGALLERAFKSMMPYFVVFDPKKSGTLRFDTWDQVEAYYRSQGAHRRYEITWELIA